MSPLVRVAISVLVAAATAASIFAGAILIYAQYFREPRHDAIVAAGVFWQAAFIVALGYGIFFGVPAYLLVKWLKLVTWWMSLICGFVIGVGLSMFLGLVGPMAEYYLVSLGVAGVLGSLSAFAAWLTWYMLGRRMADPRAAK